VQEKNFSEQHPQPAPSNELHAAHMGEIVFSKSNILSAKSKLSDFTNSFGSGDNICARMYLKQPLALYPVEKGKWLCTTGEYEGVFVGDPTANAQSSQSGASSHVFLLFSFQVDGKNYCPAGKPGVVGEEYGQGNQEARDYLCANVKPVTLRGFFCFSFSQKIKQRRLSGILQPRDITSWTRPSKTPIIAEPRQGTGRRFPSSCTQERMPSHSILRTTAQSHGLGLLFCNR
jgi:hypothetical protein